MEKGIMVISKRILSCVLSIILVLSFCSNVPLRVMADESGEGSTSVQAIELRKGEPYNLEIEYRAYYKQEVEYEDEDGNTRTTTDIKYDTVDAPEGMVVTYTPDVDITADKAILRIDDESRCSTVNDFFYNLYLYNAKIDGKAVEDGVKVSGRLTVTIPGEQYSAEYASIWQNKSSDESYEMEELDARYDAEARTYSFIQYLGYYSYENSLSGYSTVNYSLSGTLIPMTVMQNDSYINSGYWKVKEGISAYFIPDEPLVLDYNLAEIVEPAYLYNYLPQKGGFGIYKDSFYYGLYSCKIPVTHSRTITEQTCKGLLKVPAPDGYSGKSAILSTEDQFIGDEGGNKVIRLNEYTEHSTADSTDEWALIPVELKYTSVDNGADGKQYYLNMDEYYITFSKIAEDTGTVTIPIYQQTGEGSATTVAVGRDPTSQDTGKSTSVSLKNNKTLRFITPYSDSQYCTMIDDETGIFDVKASDGYDKAQKYSYYMYATDYFEKDYSIDESYEAVMTIPAPQGYDAASAVITSLKRYSDHEAPYMSNVAAIVNQDGTVSFPITFYINDNTNGFGYEISMHIVVQFKKQHTHTESGQWSYNSDEHWKECTECNEVAVARASHTWNAGVETKTATVDAEGVMTYTCTVCGATKTEAIAKLASTTPSTGGSDSAPSGGGQADPGSGSASSGSEQTGSDTSTGTAEQTTVTEGTKTEDTSGATYTVTETAANSESGVVEVEYTATAASTEKKVTIPSTVEVNGVTATVTSIADNAFSGNKTITTVTIPATVEEIGDSAFKNCSGLTTVTIPASVEEIGDSAFQNCTKLKKVTIPKNVESVGKNAFAGCSSLTTVDIKSTTITKIDQGAFKNCKKLTKVTVTKNVTTIGKEAFSGDKKLKTITIKSTKLKSVGKNAFKNVPKSTVIKVPKKQKKAYTKLLKKAGFKGKIK